MTTINYSKSDKKFYLLSDGSEQNELKKLEGKNFKFKIRESGKHPRQDSKYTTFELVMVTEEFPEDEVLADGV